MAKNNQLQVAPDAIFFREIAVGESDFSDIYITNMSSTPIRVRCSLSRNSCPFSLSNEGTILLAPGLETKVSVSYTAKESKVFSGELYVETKSSKITIPIKASPPSSNIVSDINLINLGQLSVDEENKFIFSLTNAGLKEGNFSINCENDGIIISPRNGQIQPGRSQDINCTAKPLRVGKFSFPLVINCPENLEPCKPVKIKGDVMKNNVMLLFNEKPTTEFDFQTIYFKQKRVIKAKIVNTGILARSFVIFPPQDRPISAQSTLSSFTQKTDGSIDTTFSAFPSEGLLEPSKSETINFVFQPEMEKNQMADDIENLYNHFTFIEIVETGQRIDLQFNGKAVIHQSSLSSVDFNFGKCGINTKTIQKLTITNESHFLETVFELSPIAHFRFKPSKGEIKPGKSKDVQIIFYPKNYGIFETSTNVLFSDGLFKKSINLVAECGDPTAKPFKRAPIFEKDENVMFEVLHPDKRYAYGMDEIQQNSLKRTKFDTYITDYAKKREKVKEKTEFLDRTTREAKSQLVRTVGQYTDEDLNEIIQQKIQEHDRLYDNEFDLGLTHCEGMKAPEPAIQRKPSPLFLLHPEKFGIVKESKRSQTAFHTRRKMQIDEGAVSKKKFKPKPTTPQEVNDCARALTPAQQLMVSASHQQMNFGAVSVFASVTKSFNVANNLQQNISVNIQIENEELSQSGPLSQVIPPRSIAGFDITFCCKKQMNFLGNVHYSINGRHSTTFQVAAQVMPIEVQLSRNIIEFRFSPDSIAPVIKEFVTVTNNSIGPAQYTWKGMNNFFTLSQVSGVIEPNKVHNLEITYTPTTHSHDETTLIINVVGGSSRALRCIGDVGVPKVSVSKKVASFGLIPIGITKTMPVRLKNSGDDDALFTITHGDMSELIISPANGRITAHDSLNLQINIKSVHAHMIEMPVTIAIAGAQSISFTVTAQSELPSVHLQNAEFDFGRLFVGSSASLPASLNNDGAIPAILYLDLSAHPEFHIEFAADLADNGEKSNSISLVSDTVFVTKSEMKQSSATSSMTSITQSKLEEESTTSRTMKEEPSNGLVYKIYVIEKSSISFNFVYQPTQVGEHSFELPFTMMNVISASSFHLQPIVSGEAIHAPLWVSDSSLDFEVAPIFNTSNPHSRPVVRQISIRNEHKTALKWRFDIDNKFCKDPTVFSVEPNFGTIEFAQSKNINVSFTPRESIPYSMHLPIYCTIDKDENLIGQVQLTGVGARQMYRMSADHVCLPIVPLNVKSQMNIFVLNEGFIEATLRVKMAIDDTHFPIKINFPNGQKLEHTTDKLPVSISFVSSKPMSFSTVVAFIDDNGGATTFEVICTTDNSLFTLYPFFADKPFTVKAGGGKPILYESKTVSKINALTGRFLSVDDINNLRNEYPNNWTPTCSDMMIKFVIRYLNALVMSSQISDFPGDFVRNDCALLLEVINNLSNGKKIPGDNDRNEPPKDALTKRRDMIVKIIRFLESYGALLSSVKPEFLLPKADFLQIMRGRLTKQLLGINKFNSPEANEFDQKVLSEFTSAKAYSDGLLQRLKVLENLYNALSTESWMIVIMQMLKIFTISRIDTDRLAKTPGVQAVIKSVQALSARFSSVEELLSEIIRPAKSILSSNVFNVSEGALLKWISLHYCNTTNDLQRTITTFNALNDGLALASLIKSHTTTINVTLNEQPTDRASRENNAIEVTTAIKELKLGFCPRTDEIVDGCPCILALTSAYLFETLPHFLPQSTLEFVTSLHKTMTKNITVTNPSKTEIKYTANLDAGSNYSLVTNNFIIGPNQTVDFQVVFNARTIKPVVGRISLTPSRPRFVNVSSQNQATSTKPSTSVTSSSSLDSGRGTPQMPVFSAPIVVDLISDITLTQPDGTYNIEGQIYVPTKLTIPIKNYIGVPSSVRLVSRITQTALANGSKINQAKTIQEQMIDLIRNPYEEEIQVNEADSQLTNFIKTHKMFIFSQKQIDFLTPDAEVELEIEFIPITLGEYRCLMLFEDEKNGEFIIEVIAKAILPDTIEVATGKLKAEANKTCSYSIQLDQMNINLLKALAYSIEKTAAVGQFISERKLKDMLTRRQHECESLFRTSFQSQKFTINNSSPTFFEIQNEVTVYKSALAMAAKDGQKDQVNCIPITFKPVKAGDYPCKLLLMSKNDVRLLTFKGIGIAATKTLSLDFSTVIGKPMKQDVPLQNMSDDVWNYKISISGDSSFNAPTKLMIKPKQQMLLPVNFNPHKIGDYTAEMTILNLNKEATLIYALSAFVEEPPAEEKIIVECQARHKTKKVLNVKANIIRSANIQVTTTIPIITFKSDLSFANSDPTQPFEYQIYAPRSGVAAGTITFTDTATKNFIWYILEIHVDTPAPEQTIEVSTDARKCATVKIPIANPKNEPAQFTVVLSDDDLFGEKTFIAAPNKTTDYILIVSPLKAMKRASSVYFYSDDDGEFWYSLHIEANEPPASTLAPLTSPLGKFASTFIVLENPLEKSVSFRVDNDNPTAFHIVSKRVVQLGSLEKKRIEVRYIPTMLGVKELATISFKSNEVGDWIYKLTGTGKPPQPLSPIIVAAPVLSTNSALVLFSNPFPYPCRFSVTMNCEGEADVFKFLVKRKVFNLSSFGEEYQIPFTFSPNSLGQFQANIIVASLGASRGPLPNLSGEPYIQWVFPIIGNSIIESTNDVKVIKCRAQENLENELRFPLVGEKEIFEASDYNLKVTFPQGYEFVNYVFDIKPKQIQRADNKTEIIAAIRFSPKRPLLISIPLEIKNPLGQEWQFQIDLRVDRGKPTASISIESLLNKTGTTLISVPVVFREQTPFHAYFVQGSALEFTVQPEHGFIQPSFAITESWTELPVQVIFAPKMYGKVLKGLLVIDTLDSQYLFDVVGKTPEYIPPIIQDGTSKSRLGNVINKEDIKRMQPKRDKRKIIKENIELAKKPHITSPHVLRK